MRSRRWDREPVGTAVGTPAAVRAARARAPAAPNRRNGGVLRAWGTPGGANTGTANRRPGVARNSSGAGRGKTGQREWAQRRDSVAAFSRWRRLKAFPDHGRRRGAKRRRSLRARSDPTSGQARQQQDALETRARSTWRRRVRSCRFMSPIQPGGSPAGQEGPGSIPYPGRMGRAAEFRGARFEITRNAGRGVSRYS